MSDFFSWKVLSDEELQAQRKILPKGLYDFQITNAENKTSSTGNPMIVLFLNVWDDEGKIHVLRDWLVSVDTMAFKIKHFWEAVGYPENYTKGGVSVADFIGKSGKVYTKIRKDDKGNDQASIEDYAKPDASSSVKQKVENGHATSDFKDDKDIPF